MCVCVCARTCGGEAPGFWGPWLNLQQHRAHGTDWSEEADASGATVCSGKNRQRVQQEELWEPGWGHSPAVQSCSLGNGSVTQFPHLFKKFIYF